MFPFVLYTVIYRVCKVVVIGFSCAWRISYFAGGKGVVAAEASMSPCLCLIQRAFISGLMSIIIRVVF